MCDSILGTKILSPKDRGEGSRGPAPHRSNRTARTALAKPRGVYLCQEDDAFAIWPDDVVHLRTDSLPRQLRGAEAGLKGTQHSEGRGSPEAEGKAQLGADARAGSPRRSLCWSGPCCTRCSCSSCGPGAPASPHSCSLQGRGGAEDSGAGEQRCQVAVSQNTSRKPAVLRSVGTPCAQKRAQGDSSSGCVTGWEMEQHKKPSGKKALCSGKRVQVPTASSSSEARTRSTGLTSRESPSELFKGSAEWSLLRAGQSADTHLCKLSRHPPAG